MSHRESVCARLCASFATKCPTPIRCAALNACIISRMSSSVDKQNGTKFVHAGRLRHLHATKPIADSKTIEFEIDLRPKTNTRASRRRTSIAHEQLVGRPSNHSKHNSCCLRSALWCVPHNLCMPNKFRTQCV